MSRKTPRTIQIQKLNAVLFPLGRKICLRCEKEQSLDDFTKNNRVVDGKQIYCKTCQADYHTIYGAKNRDTLNQKGRVWKEANREHHRAYSRAYGASHADKVNECSRIWRKKNPERNCENTLRRRALKKSVAVGKVDYKRILERDGCICHICRQAIDLTIKKGTGKLTFDHVMPLARGGAHSEENIKPAHEVCNKRKWAHIMEAS